MKEVEENSTVPEGKKIKLMSRKEFYLVAAFFGFILSFLLFIFFTPNYYDTRAPVKVIIKEGSTLNEIIDTLYTKEIIPNKLNMQIAAFIYGAEKRIKAGRYNIPNGLSYLQLVELLIGGSPEKEKLVTIPEGIWQHKLAGLLSEELGIDSAKFMYISKNRNFVRNLGIDADNIEGYLLPETYYFYLNTSEEEIIRKLKINMDRLFNDKAFERMQLMGMTKHQILTMASLIEGESNYTREFPRIAGVYYNRLKKNMLLQADPTIQYLKRNSKKFNRILFKDLEIDSPYNTYMYGGLPPGPINNPGKAAVLAALYPEKHDYLFFVASGKGDHLFAETHSKHLQNVRKYRIWRRSQN